MTQSIDGEWVPVRDYFKSRMIFLAETAPTKKQQKTRLLQLYEARIITSAEVMNLLEKNELKHA